MTMSPSLLVVSSRWESGSGRELHGERRFKRQGIGNLSRCKSANLYPAGEYHVAWSTEDGDDGHRI